MPPGRLMKQSVPLSEGLSGRVRESGQVVGRYLYRRNLSAGRLVGGKRDLEGDFVVAGQREDQPDAFVDLLAANLPGQAVDALSGIRLDVDQFMLAEQSQVVADQPDALVELLCQARDRLRLFGQMPNQFESHVAAK